MLAPAGVPSPRCCFRLAPFLALAPSFSASPSPVAPLCRHSSLPTPSVLAFLRANTLPAGTLSRWHPSVFVPCPAGAVPCWRLALTVPLPSGASRWWCASLVLPFPRCAPPLWRPSPVVRIGALRRWRPLLLASLAGGASHWWCPSLVLLIHCGAPLWWRPSPVVPIGVRHRLRPPLLASLHTGVFRCCAPPSCCRSMDVPLPGGAPPYWSPSRLAPLPDGSSPCFCAFRLAYIQAVALAQARTHLAAGVGSTAALVEILAAQYAKQDALPCFVVRFRRVAA